MQYNFLKKLKDKTDLVGTILSLNSPEIAEIIAMSGFDWVFIDMEHGTLTTDQTQHLIQTIGGNCSALIRIPENNSIWIKKALDTGCEGIIIPQIKTATDAEHAVNAAKYPPIGSRSVGIARAQGYGMNFDEYIKNANDEIALILQIEHIEALDNLNAILDVKGIDGILIGPYDLSGSMHMLGQVTSEPVQQVIDKIKIQCKNKSIPWGTFVLKPEAVQKEKADGCSFIAVGIDTTLFVSSLKNLLAVAKGEEIKS